MTPPHLDLGVWPEPYAVVMCVLFALFIGRVVGQILAATARPRWLPPMNRWYSGVMPYRYLLPAQLVIIVLMAAMVFDVYNAAGFLGRSNERLGAAAVWASYVYAAGMVWRAIRRALQPPERKGVVIPIIFHFVLAAFLFVFGSWHLVLPDARRMRRTYDPTQQTEGWFDQRRSTARNAPRPLAPPRAHPQGPLPT